MLLPVELIREIIINVSQMYGPGALTTLAVVSKTFHNLVLPILYHHILLDMVKPTLSFIHGIKAAHALPVDNAKYVAVLSFDADVMEYFDDVMSLPGLKPQTLMFDMLALRSNIDQVALGWDARPKCIGLMQDCLLTLHNPWVCHRMALFSHLTHLYLQQTLDDDTVLFCLELRTLTHICVPMLIETESEEALRHIQLLLCMPSMELVLIIAASCDTLYEEVEDDTWKDRFTRMGYPKGDSDLFPLLADSIPDERLYVQPFVHAIDVFSWLWDGLSPWDLGRRRLTMPWRKAVKVQ